MRPGSFVVGFAIVLFQFAAVSQAETHTAISPNFSDVRAAVTAAQDGDTIAIPAGTATWTESLDIKKGITIQGAGSEDTTIVNDIPGLGAKAVALFNLHDGGGSAPRRVTGIGMRSRRVTNDPPDKQGAGVGAFGYGTLKRIDHCQFDDLYAGVMIGSSNGVTDHNSYFNCAYAWRHFGYSSSPTPGKSGQQYAWDTFRPLAFDSLNYFFHEDETMDITGDAQICSTAEANSCVVRHCKIVLRELHIPYAAARCLGLFDIHGDNPDARQYSALTTLIYENIITINRGAIMSFATLRGGSAMIFNNRIASYGGRGSATVQVREERYEYGRRGVTLPLNPKLGTWPAWEDAQYEDVVHDVYIAGNTYNGIEHDPSTHTYSKNLVIATDPKSGPNANAYTTLPRPLVTPPYPHPLVKESASQTK